MATDTDTKTKEQQPPAAEGNGTEDGKPDGSGLPPTPPPSEDERIAPPKEETTKPPQGGSDPGTLSGKPLKDLDEGGEDTATTDVSGAGAVQRAATGRKLSDREQSAALDWLLQADPDPGELETKVLNLNFGTQDKPEPRVWEIQPVGLDEMRRIRDRAKQSRTARRSGQVDETRMNLQVMVAGTKTPDVRRAAEIARDSGNGTGDPVEILRARFQSKPGYIAQISAEIMSLSGFDDDDVTEKDMVEAAGNS